MTTLDRFNTKKKVVKDQIFKKYWWLKSILIPFITTRSLLVLTGYLAPLFLPFSHEEGVEIANRGWWFFENRLPDMWFRWDAFWYLTIVNEGYRMLGNLHTISNLAFFPVYPLLIKFMVALFPKQLINNQLIVTVGLILSNLMLLGSLFLIYKLCESLFDKASAKLSVWLILVFPTSFFLSSFYTESTLLFFSLLTLWLAKKQKWGWASIAAAITGASRPVGLMIALPLVWEYLRSKEWKLKKIDLSIFWLFLLPVGVLVFFSHSLYLTGDFFATLKIQGAWGKQYSNPISSFLNPNRYWPLITNLDRIVIIGVILSAIKMISMKNKGFESLLPWGIYSLLLIIPNLFTGILDSTTRYAVVIFPVFMLMGHLLAKYLAKNKGVRLAIMVGLMVLQLVLFARYSQFYWAG
ncbi:MAG: hypothetical protein U9O78_01275 [Patescibacteria group bacterium]|nr:hypothetical protein [Patescibacteria group bacterium]